MKGTKLAVLIAAMLTLQSCFFAPGKFASTLDLRRDGRFSFSYAGEVLFLDESMAPGSAETDICYSSTTSKPAAASRDEPGQRPVATDSEADDDGDTASVEVSMDERPCTPAEKAERAADRARQKKEMATMMGAVVGFDPGDPASVSAYIAELKRYKGWRSVVHRGGNRFEVDYRNEGTLGQDFLFPIFDRVVVHTPFVTVRPRTDGSVEVRAPAFGDNAFGSAAGLSGMMGKMGAGSAKDGDAVSKLLKTVDGSFTIVTDGDIRTNNTTEGATTRGGDKVLTWKVSTLSREAPRALVALR